MKLDCVVHPPVQVTPPDTSTVHPAQSGIRTTQLTHVLKSAAGTMEESVAHNEHCGKKFDVEAPGTQFVQSGIAVPQTSHVERSVLMKLVDVVHPPVQVIAPFEPTLQLAQSVILLAHETHDFESIAGTLVPSVEQLVQVGT
jgi:hypothetical protein